MKLFVHSFLALDRHAFGCFVTRSGLHVPEELAQCFTEATFLSAEDFVVTVRTHQNHIVTGLVWRPQLVLAHTKQLFEMLDGRMERKLLRLFTKSSMRRLASVH